MNLEAEQTVPPQENLIIEGQLLTDPVEEVAPVSKLKVTQDAPQQEGSKPHAEKSLIIKFLPSTFSSESLYALFSEHGEIESCKVATNKNSGASLGYGFVKYKSERSASAALKDLNGTYIQGKVLKVTFVDKAKKTAVKETSGGSVDQTESIKSNIYIAGLPHQWGKADLQQFFSSFGRVINCKVLFDSHGESRNIGFVQFSTTSAAQHAIDATNRLVLPGAPEPAITKFARDVSSMRYGLDHERMPYPVQRDGRRKKKNNYMGMEMGMDQSMPMYGQGLQLGPPNNDLVASMGNLNLGGANNMQQGSFKHKSQYFRHTMNYPVQNMYYGNMMDNKNMNKSSNNYGYQPSYQPLYNNQHLMMNNSLPGQIMVDPNGNMMPMDTYGLLPQMLMRPAIADIPSLTPAEEVPQSSP